MPPLLRRCEGRRAEGKVITCHGHGDDEHKHMMPSWPVVGATGLLSHFTIQRAGWWGCCPDGAAGALRA